VVEEIAARKKRPITAQQERDALLLAILRGRDELESPGDALARLARDLSTPATDPTFDEIPWIDAMRSTVAACLRSGGE
jgi:hypothetical protein